MHWEEKGAYTGEVSGQMLKSIGVEYVIIGKHHAHHNGNGRKTHMMTPIFLYKKSTETSHQERSCTMYAHSRSYLHICKLKCRGHPFGQHDELHVRKHGYKHICCCQYPKVFMPQFYMYRCVLSIHCLRLFYHIQQVKRMFSTSVACLKGLWLIRLFSVRERLVFNICDILPYGIGHYAIEIGISSKKSRVETFCHA